MALTAPMPLSISPLSRSPESSRSSSLAGKPRKPSPLRRSSTPEDSEQLRMSTATRHVEDAVGHENGENHETNHVGGTKDQQSSRDQETQMRRSSEGGVESASTETARFNSTTSSKSESNQSTSSHDITPNSSTRSSFDENTVTSTQTEPSHQLPATRTISNSKYSLPPIRPTPKFPHSTPIRPLKPLSTVSGGGGGGFGSLSSVPHAGAGVAQAPQRQKIIVPSKSWKACFDLNLTQKELARFD